MNLFCIFSTEEKELLKTIGIIIENRDYKIEEIIKIRVTIEEFLMNHSVKNGDVGKYINKYNSILNKVMKCLSSN